MLTATPNYFMPNYKMKHQYFFEPWLSYSHPVVRQLAFCIASPNIIQAIPNDLTIYHAFSFHTNEDWYEYYDQYKTRLNELDQNPTPLLDFLSQLKSTRLGLRFEMFLWFWLLDEDYHHFKVLGHSVQQILGSKTLGELDFVVLNKKNDRIEHWEVALKYYLAEKNMQFNDWFGLNRDDKLEKKLSHATYRQFQFDHALGYSIDQKIAVFKGQLYISLKEQNNLPHWINPERRLGYWGNTILPNFYRLSRQEWITPNLKPTSPIAQWWINGLYHHVNDELFYMYRAASPLYIY